MAPRWLLGGSKVALRWLLGGSMVAPWWLLGGSKVAPICVNSNAAALGAVVPRSYATDGQRSVDDRTGWPRRPCRAGQLSRCRGWSWGVRLP